MTFQLIQRRVSHREPRAPSHPPRKQHAPPPPLTIVIVIHPIVLLLPGFVPRVPRVVHGQTLALRSAQYAHDRLRHALRRHYRAPICAEQRQAYVAVGVHVLVAGGGREEVHRGGTRGVIGGELYPQPVRLAGVYRVRRHVEGDDPKPHVLPGYLDGEAGGGEERNSFSSRWMR